MIGYKDFDDEVLNGLILEKKEINDRFLAASELIKRLTERVEKLEKLQQFG
jgi:hypothetical protein